MRELKFRAWDTSMKTMHELAGFIQYKQFTEIIYGSSGFSRGNSFIIMQFTGLYDKNNKPIYEGDIVTSSWRELYQVFWEGSGWKLKSLKFKTRPNSLRGVCPKREVVGNIYENPELL